MAEKTEGVVTYGELFEKVRAELVRMMRQYGADIPKFLGAAQQLEETPAHFVWPAVKIITENEGDLIATGDPDLISDFLGLFLGDPESAELIRVRLIENDEIDHAVKTIQLLHRTSIVLLGEGSK